MLFKVLNTGQEPSHHLPASTPVHIYFNMTDQIRFVFIFDFFKNQVFQETLTLVFLFSR